MNRRLFRIVLLLAIAAILTLAARKTQAVPPSVHIFYDARQDTACGADIEAAWQAELRTRLDPFLQEWADLGPRLMAATERLTGRPFALPATEVRLTLCNTPSDSRGEVVLVNMRYALASFTPQPVSLRYKAGIAYHELLHRYLRGAIATDSALLSANTGESAMVQNHLHLLALMKAGYLSLGLAADLDELIANDNKLPSGVYRRAWSLVNRGESTYRDYVAELKRPPQ